MAKWRLKTVDELLASGFVARYPDFPDCKSFLPEATSIGGPSHIVGDMFEGPWDQDRIAKIMATRKPGLAKPESGYLYVPEHFTLDEDDEPMRGLDAIVNTAPHEIRWRWPVVPLPAQIPLSACECGKEKFRFTFHERWCPEFVHAFDQATAALELKTKIEALAAGADYRTPGDIVAEHGKSKLLINETFRPGEEPFIEFLTPELPPSLGTSGYAMRLLDKEQAKRLMELG